MAELAYVGGKIDESGYSTPWYSTITSGSATNVSLTAWRAVQRAAGANMSVDISLGVGFIPISSAYGYWGEVTSAAKNIAVTAADPSNPRIDRVVAYIDLATISTSVTNNTGALKFLAVAGTAAGSPTAPSNATVQTAVGASNPYIDIATVAVAAGATSVSTANITDKRTPVASRLPLAPRITAISTTTVLSWGYDHVSCSAAITVTLPDATLNPGGKITLYKTDTISNILTVSTTSSQTINGSSNDYISNIYDFVEYTSTGTNWLISRERRNPLLAIATSTSNFVTTSASAVLITGMTVNPYVPAGTRRISVRYHTTERPAISGGTGTADVMVWDGTVASGTLVARTTATSNGFIGRVEAETQPIALSAGNAKTYNAGADISGGFTLTLAGAADSPMVLEARLAT